MDDSKVLSVIVLGCGPSGLMAAHAAARRGHDVRILSRKVQSRIGGAQFLHDPIPGVSGSKADSFVRFLYRGTKEGYATKVYGDPKADVSFAQFRPLLPIWNLKDTYEKLWEEYETLIEPADLNEFGLEMVAGADLVLSTVPRPLLCKQETRHTFAKQRVWILYRPTNERGEMVFYNGEPDVSWYRHSILFGWESYEWAQEPPIAVGQVVQVDKPLMTDCDCHPEIRKLGRYGQWRKGVLTHHAYQIANRLLEGVERGIPDAVQ